MTDSQVRPRHRPSARALPQAPRDVVAELATKHATRRAVLRDASRRGREMFVAAPDAELYSVDVAQHLGIHVAHAQQILLRLEGSGLLTSRVVPSPISNARRYYRLAPSVASEVSP